MSKILSGVLLVCLVLCVVTTAVFETVSPGPTPPPKVCKISDTVTGVRDEYKGAWKGSVRIVTYKSGQITNAGPAANVYVGKEVCREWL